MQMRNTSAATSFIKASRIYPVPCRQFHFEYHLPRYVRNPITSTTGLKRYATSNGLGGTKTSSRKQVTVVNDDGRVQWKDLSRGEKAARTTQQTFNFGIVLAGLLGTVRTSSTQYINLTDRDQGFVGYFLYTEVFASDSKTRQFNRAVDQVRADPRALELLGSGQTIRAFGEPTANKWARARPLA